MPLVPGEGGLPEAGRVQSGAGKGRVQSSPAPHGRGDRRGPEARRGDPEVDQRHPGLRPGGSSGGQTVRRLEARRGPEQPEVCRRRQGGRDSGGCRL